MSEDNPTCGSCGCARSAHNRTLTTRGWQLTWCGQCNTCDSFCLTCGYDPCVCGHCEAPTAPTREGGTT